ncbi:hypothetical protein ENBRE01_0395 [Enteropsectra breve]|nr:hypothetical protein ENBRE01_0395 [Enteropsectra breve]
MDGKSGALLMLCMQMPKVLLLLLWLSGSFQKPILLIDSSQVLPIEQNPNSKAEITFSKDGPAFISQYNETTKTWDTPIPIPLLFSQNYEPVTAAPETTAQFGIEAKAPMPQQQSQVAPIWNNNSNAQAANNPNALAANRSNALAANNTAVVTPSTLAQQNGKPPESKAKESKSKTATKKAKEKDDTQKKKNGTGLGTLFLTSGLLALAAFTV